VTGASLHAAVNVGGMTSAQLLLHIILLGEPATAAFVGISEKKVSDVANRNFVEILQLSLLVLIQANMVDICVSTGKAVNDCNHDGALFLGK
jgi:DMSO reductase anchor subunit